MIPLVLRLKIYAPLNRVLELSCLLFSGCSTGFCVGYSCRSPQLTILLRSLSSSTPCRYEASRRIPFPPAAFSSTYADNVLYSCPLPAAIISSSSANAISGSIIQNSDAWRAVFEFSAAGMSGPKVYTFLKAKRVDLALQLAAHCQGKQAFRKKSPAEIYLSCRRQSLGCRARSIKMLPGTFRPRPRQSAACDYRRVQRKRNRCSWKNLMERIGCKRTSPGILRRRCCCAV